MIGRLLQAAALAVLGAAVLVGLAGGPAVAHALLQSSDPAAGQSLSVAPAAVTITFTEAPDPKLSSIRVLDSSGAAVAAGATEGVPGAPTQLRVALPPLQPGVYTVSWRTVSSIDGHLATGSFAFGVGVAPPAGNAAAGSVAGSAQLSPLGVAGRWLLYAGLMMLLGVCWMLLRGGPGPARWPALPDSRPLGPIVGLAALAAALGTLAVLADQVAAAGIALGDIPGTSFGTAALLRGVPLLAGVGAFALIYLHHTSRPAVVLLTSTALGAMGADVALSHAAASATPLFDAVVQWLHVVAAGMWLGGLASLLVWLRRRAPDETAVSVARRFSRVATVALALVVVTGILRAVPEIGTVDALFATDFGRLVLAKSALLAVLAGLGAINHFRNIPRGLPGLSGVKRIGPAELSVAALIVLLSAALVNVAPPTEAAASAAPANVVVGGADFGTTLRAQLTVAPGTAGFNTFMVAVRDFDSGAPLVPDSVALRFALPARPDVGGSRLDLQRQPDGTFAASGTNLSIDGMWSVTVVISHGASAAEVPLELTTRIVRQPVDISRQPGLPTIYTVHLDAGRTVQVYIDPGTPGANEVHATFFDTAGTELPVTNASMAIGPEGEPAAQLEPRMLEPGHFVADQTLTAGTYLLTITGPAPDGSDTLVARTDVEVSP
jgi:copper transport protein